MSKKQDYKRFNEWLDGTRTMGGYTVTRGLEVIRYRGHENVVQYKMRIGGEVISSSEWSYQVRSTIAHILGV